MVPGIVKDAIGVVEPRRWQQDLECPRSGWMASIFGMVIPTRGRRAELSIRADPTAEAALDERLEALGGTKT
jgi:hypothetical protein